MSINSYKISNELKIFTFPKVFKNSEKQKNDIKLRLENENENQISNLEIFFPQKYHLKEIFEVLKQYPYFYSIKSLFKEFFNYQNVSSMTIQSLNFYELRRLMDFLNFEINYYEKIEKKRGEILLKLNEFLEDFIFKKFNGNEQIFMSKIFIKIIKKMFNDFLLKTKVEDLKINYRNLFINQLFDFPNKENKILIEYCMNNCEMNEILYIMSYRKFKINFQITLNEYIKEKKHVFFKILTFNMALFNLNKDINPFRIILQELCAHTFIINKINTKFYLFLI